MVPAPQLLPEVLPTTRLNGRGMPTREIRDELRQIPNLRNLAAVTGAWLQTFGVCAVAGYLHTWWAYLVAFILMGPGHARLAILSHEAAHRLLFSNRRANDLVGRFGAGYPGFTATLAYRRAHFAHHRDEMGPKEPDTELYAGYPIGADSWRRKLRRDLFGISGWKNLKVLLGAVRRGKREALQIAAVQLVMLGTAVALGRPLAYLVWFAAWMTLWRVLNRLRAIAEHGGMMRSRDRRETTHVIEQSRLASAIFVPYNTGYHLAHHVDMGVPWTKLPALHQELVASGWVTPDIVYPNYRTFWKQVSSGEVSAGRQQRSTGNSQLDFDD